jgi:UDP-glucose 4-epimerase
MSLNILVTGGLGFIGSHTCVELLNQGHFIIIVDNLKNSKYDVYDKITRITGNDNHTYYKADLNNLNEIDEIFKSNSPIDLVIHFAGLKSVGESVQNPLLYYEENIMMTLNLVKVMKKHNCKKIIFSSSATVYGTPRRLPIVESDQVGLNMTNPYGKTKYFQEEIFKDLYVSDNQWSIILLRYFNPVGAHPSGLIGENPNDIPNNLMPYLSDVAIGKRSILNIFGRDWETPDGTCIRDFIHVVDLAKGHVSVLQKLDTIGIHIYNLGSGRGTSVLELVNTFMKVNNVNIPYQFVERRSGDVEATFASAEKANIELGWKTTLSIEDMCRDTWKYINNNN